MSDKMREEFECWWVSVRLRKQPEKFLNGDYCAPSVYNSWEAWQASRSALMVELPPTITALEVKESGLLDDDADQNCADMVNGAISACATFIHATGVTTK